MDVIDAVKTRISTRAFLDKQVSQEAVQEILKEVKQKGAEKRALLTPEEFKEIVNRKTGA